MANYCATQYACMVAQIASAIAVAPALVGTGGAVEVL
jgi:hypothetical protein